MKKTQMTKTSNPRKFNKMVDKLMVKPYRPLSAWNYFWRSVLYAIPVIGWIFLLVHAIKCKNLNARNFARSFFCTLLVVAVVGAIAVASYTMTPNTPEEPTPEVTTPEVTTPEATTPEQTTPEQTTPDTPDVFEGIEFSDPAVVLPAAYALAKGETLEGTYTLKGKITETGSFNAADKDMHVTIVVDGYEDYPLYCYFLKNCTPEVSVGDYVAVQGIIKNYNGTIEFERPNMIAHEDVVVPPSGDEDASSYDDIQTDDPAVVLPLAYALASGAYLDGTYTLKGQIIEAGSYNSQYGDISVTIAIEGYEDYPMYCYQIKKDADKISLGDYIAVQGKIKNYQGLIEFEKPELLAYKEGTLAPSIDIEPKPGTGLAEGYDVITVEQALEIAKLYGDATTRYYILATVSTVTNGAYGAMYIEDATGSISVYGTYSEDGSIGYANMAEKPTKGDLVLLSCTLQTYNEKAEVANARLIKFEKVQLDESIYTEMTINEARNAQEGDLVKVTGVVAQITYASGFVPNGVYLVDGTNSIYVFDSDLAGSVSVGNTVTVLAEKIWWILDTEVSFANKFGYNGCNQLADAWLLANDGGNSEPDYSWVTESTVKDIMETPFTTDITTTVYKVTALVKESIGQGFINYYIDDIDGITGSYIYTQCNGGDLDWLKEFDGKICTVYLSVINAKSTATGCVWRFKALKVVDEGFTFDNADAPQYAIDYHALGQFESKYTADPAQEMMTSVSSDLLGFENVLLSYSSDNNDIVYFEVVDGKVIMHCGTVYGTVNVTITATLGEATVTKTIAVENAEAPKIDYITVADAIEAADEEIITVKGIVGPSLVNQTGFYLFGEDGSMIAVKVLDKDQFEGLSIGNEVILTGKREIQKKDDAATSYHGQTCIEDATIVVNNKGEHAYSTEKFITDKTIAEVVNYAITEDHTTEIYVFTGKLTFPSGYGQPAINDAAGNKIGFYCSGVGQYSFLQPYANQEVTLEIAICNWNGKTYWTGCVLAIRLSDGTTIVNTLNFN